MSPWPRATLVEVADGGLFADGDWVESKDQDPSGTVRLVQLADVGVASFRDRSDRWMRPEQAKALNCTYLETGDILVARMPDPIGRACLVPPGIGGSVTAVDVAILRVKRGDALPAYVMWAINSPGFHASVEALQSGTTRKRISRKNLAGLTIPLPPLGEQRRIVDILEDNLSRLDAAEHSIRASIHRAGALRRSHLELVLNDEGRDLSLSDVAVWGSGGTPSSGVKAFYEGGDIPWVNSGDLEDNELEDVPGRITTAGLEASSAKWVPPGSVLVAMYGATIGKLGITTIPVTINQAIAFAVPKPDVVSGEYLFWYLRTQRRALAHAGQGGAQPNISQAVLKSWPIRVPSLERQAIAVEMAKETDASVLRMVRGLQALLARTVALRRSILNAAFSGRLPGTALDSSIDSIVEEGALP